MVYPHCPVRPVSCAFSRKSIDLILIEAHFQRGTHHGRQRYETFPTARGRYRHPVDGCFGMGNGSRPCGRRGLCPRANHRSKRRRQLDACRSGSTGITATQAPGVRSPAGFFCVFSPLWSELRRFFAGQARLSNPQQSLCALCAPGLLGCFRPHRLKQGQPDDHAPQPAGSFFTCPRQGRCRPSALCA